MAAILGDAFCEGGASAPSFWIAILVVGVLWTLWFFIFRRWAKKQQDHDKLPDRLTSLLLKGSILELLVAVSCHIIVRRRGDCSARGFTFLGIAAGIAVMLMAFGPGVFWLFVRRAKQITPLSKRV
jgi:cbb3-type cytochrome oxidase subunit 3